MYNGFRHHILLDPRNSLHSSIQSCVCIKLILLVVGVQSAISYHVKLITSGLQKKLVKLTYESEKVTIKTIGTTLVVSRAGSLAKAIRKGCALVKACSLAEPADLIKRNRNDLSIRQTMHSCNHVKEWKIQSLAGWLYSPLYMQQLQIDPAICT